MRVCEKDHLGVKEELGAPALWGAKGFLLCLLSSCGEAPSQDACLNQGSPTSRSYTGVGPGLLRNWATWQAVSGRQVSEDSSVFTATPRHSHPLVLGRIIFHKTGPFATKIGASWFKPLSPHCHTCKIEPRRGGGHLFKAPRWKVAKEGGALIPRAWKKEVPTERALQEETGKEGTAPVRQPLCSPCAGPGPAAGASPASASQGAGQVG